MMSRSWRRPRSRMDDVKVLKEAKVLDDVKALKEVKVLDDVKFLKEVKVLDDVQVLKKMSWPWSRSSKVKVVSEVKILIEGQDVEVRLNLEFL
jgi:hypothetical protein